MKAISNKSDTYYLILGAAKQEFMAKGYEKASMRTIAGNVGISATALYRHFKDKEDIFRVLVSPLLDELSAGASEGMAEVAHIFNNRSPEEFWPFAYEKFTDMFEFIYDHIDEFKLLASFAEGTSFQSFRSELIEQEVAEYLLIREYAAARGVPVNPVDAADLRVLVGGFIAMMFELLALDYPRDEARRRSLVIITFIQGGLRRVLGF